MYTCRSFSETNQDASKSNENISNIKEIVQALEELDDETEYGDFRYTRKQALYNKKLIVALNNQLKQLSSNLEEVIKFVEENEDELNSIHFEPNVKISNAKLKEWSK